VVSQRGSLTASFGSHRYGHGSGCTREPMAPDVRVLLATSLLYCLMVVVGAQSARVRLRTFQASPMDVAAAPVAG
jgi:hypothetical protein